MAQLTGALLAAGLLAVIWPSQPTALGTTLPSVGVGSAFAYEVPQWRWFYTQQHGDNVTYEVLVDRP